MSNHMNQTHKTLRIALISILVVLLVFTAGSLFFVKGFYDQNFPRVEERQYGGYLRYVDIKGYEPSVVHFQSGSNTLAGYLFGPSNTKGLVVVAPGLGYGAEDYLAVDIYFVDQGWRVFSFDYTGTYASEGKSTKGLPQSRLDLKAALDFIQQKDELKDLPLMLYGHSWGAYAVTAVLNDPVNVKAAASISGFNAPNGLMAETLRQELGRPLGTAAYPFGLAYQTFLFGKDASVTAVDGINRSNIPVMVIHGSGDEDILYNGASIIAQRAKITNPQVVYQTYSAENHDGHKTLFRSEAAVQYIDAKNAEFQALKDQYGEDIPASVLNDYYAGIDRFQTSELDPAFISSINTFFEQALPAK